MEKVAGQAAFVILALSILAISAAAQIPSPCMPGDERLCGSDVGECQKGTVKCTVDGWGSCEGGIKPAEEECTDGLDNDCNGLVDDCGFNTVSIILIGSGFMLLLVALILSKVGK